MADKCESENYVADKARIFMSSAAMPALRNIIRAATYAQICGMQHIWAHVRRDFIKCAAGNEALADWERRWTGRIALLCRLNGARLEQHGRRSRSGSSEPGVRGGASRTGARARAIVRGGATGTRRPPGQGPRGRAAPLPVEPSRGLERVSRQAGGADGQQSLGAPAARRGHRPAAFVRLRQRGRSPGSPRRCIRRSAPWH